jgi:hypothetical protein
MISGAGNPVGGTAGIGTTINYVVDRIYGYSGVIDTNGGATMLQFETGSELIDAIVQTFNTDNDATVIDWEIFFNSQQISGYFSEGRGSAEREHGNQIPLVIPPYTRVLIKGTSSGSVNGCTLLTGKIVN